MWTVNISYLEVASGLVRAHLCVYVCKYVWIYFDTNIDTSKYIEMHFICWRSMLTIYHCYAKEDEKKIDQTTLNYCTSESRGGYVFILIHTVLAAVVSHALLVRHAHSVYTKSGIVNICLYYASNSDLTNKIMKDEKTPNSYHELSIWQGYGNNATQWKCQWNCGFFSTRWKLNELIFHDLTFLSVMNRFSL